jgi:acyl carrier protein
MTPENVEKLTNVFRIVLNMPKLLLTENLTARDVPTWDSFNHINLVLNIEEEFNITFTTDEIASWQKVGDLISLMNIKLIK